MQFNTDFGQLLMAVDQMPRFGAGKHAVGNQGLHMCIQALRFGQPQHGMDVAQPARAGFHIRLQHRAGTLLFVMALLHFQQFAFDKQRNIALQRKLVQKSVGQLVIAADKAGFDKGGVGG